MNDTETKTQARKWTSTAGPIQTKRVNEALQAISREGQTFCERYGVEGSASESVMWSPFSPVRKEATDLMTAIAAKFDYTVTAANHHAIIAEVAARLPELKKLRPVEDKTRTLEVEAERIRLSQEAEQKRQAQQDEKDSQVDARAAELRKDYPWALPLDGGQSSHARAGANLKIELQMKFAGTAFSVRTDYNSARIRWEFGPSEREVETLIAKYKSGYYDSLQDYHGTDRSVDGLALDKVLGRFTYVSMSREISKPELNEQIGRWMCDLLGKPFVSLSSRGTIDEVDTDELGDHVWRLLRRTSFPPGTWNVTALKEGSTDEDPHAWCELAIETTAPPVAAAQSASGISVRYNTEHEGVEIAFPGKPQPSVLAKCKSYGFRWSPRSHVWYKKYSETAWKWAHEIAGIPIVAAPSTDPAGAYVQAQEDAYQDNLARSIGA